MASPLVRYRPVPTMELMPQTPTPCPRALAPASREHEHGHRPRPRQDHRRARLNTELLCAVLNGSLADASKKLEMGASVDATCRQSHTTALQLAVACGRLELVQLLLCRGASVGLSDKEGRQAVHLAAATGNILLLRLLLDSDPTVLNSTVSLSNRPLKDHVLDSWSHDHEVVANMIPVLSKSATALHIAAQRLNLDCVSEMLQRGARVDVTDERGLTPLDVVGEIVSASPTTDLLVDLADALPTSEETLSRIKNWKHRISRSSSTKSMVLRLKAPNNLKETIKKSSIRVAHPNMDQTYLHNHPSSAVYLPNTINFSDPALVVAPESPSKKDAPSLAYIIVNELIKKGAKMPASKVITKIGGVQKQVLIPTTCLHTAVEHEDIQLIEYLLDNGGCPMAWNEEGLTALHFAVKNHLLESLRILLEKNKNDQIVDACDIHGRTPLQIAVEEDLFSGVSLLLEAGADVKVTSNDNESVLHIAARKSDCQLLEELLTLPESAKMIDSRNNQHETPLFCAVNAIQLSCVKVLLSHGADSTACLPGDITLLHLAAERGSRSILEALLADHRIAQQMGFKDIRSKENKGGTSALHLAAMGGFVDCLKLLIDTGCDVFAVTTDHPHFGSTALHLAALRGHTKVVECVVNHNRNTMCKKNVDGWYPLHVAARFGKERCVQCMLLNGANLAATVFDSSGLKKTAFDIIVTSISRPLTFLERIFDCCIEKNDYPMHNPKCVIKVRYDILQPLGPHRKQMKVLDSLLSCGKMIVQEKLLLHPLVETFLYLKWKKLRLFFFLIMLLYMVFTVSLTTMAMLLYVVKIENSVVDSCVALCRMILCISLILMILQEAMQVSRMQKYYFKDLESLVKWSTFTLATVVVLGDHSSPWLVNISAVAVLLSWLELLFLLSRWPSSLGFYILMFFTVAKNVLRVFATFTFVILGFMFAFMVHFQASGPFTNWWEALVKVMVMTLEFDYGSMYEHDAEISLTSVVGRAIFLSFMILVAIVLMNLLVGLAVSDIASLEKQGRAQRLAKQIEFLSLLELFVYNGRLFCCCPKGLFDTVKRFRAAEPNLIIEPGKPLRNTRFILPKQMTDSILNRLLNIAPKSGTDSSCDEDEEDADSFFQDSTFLRSRSKIKVGRENSKENDLEINTKETLEYIVSELASIKQQIETIRLDVS